MALTVVYRVVQRAAVNKSFVCRDQCTGAGAADAVSVGSAGDDCRLLCLFACPEQISDALLWCLGQFSVETRSCALFGPS